MDFHKTFSASNLSIIMCDELYYCLFFSIYFLIFIFNLVPALMLFFFWSKPMRKVSMQAFYFNTCYVQFVYSNGMFTHVVAVLAVDSVGFCLQLVSMATNVCFQNCWSGGIIICFSNHSIYFHSLISTKYLSNVIYTLSIFNLFHLSWCKSTSL